MTHTPTQTKGQSSHGVSSCRRSPSPGLSFRLCVCDEVAVNSCQAPFPCAPWDLQGPAREPVSDWNRLSVCLLPRAPVRGLACLCISGVTQCLAECWPQSVQRTEMLAEGGRGPEQATASSGPTRQEASHREMAQSDWGPWGNSGVSGTHARSRACEI